MKCTLALLVACAAVSPIEKTVQLLGDLQAKIVKEGEAESKLFEEFSSFCNDESKETQNEIKTGKSAAERAGATIADKTATIGAAEAKIEELSSTISTNTADLTSATQIRDKEHADFEKMDADMAETVDMLGRAVGIIAREMKKGAFVQGSFSKVTDALQGLVDAASVNIADKIKVQALLQANTEVDDLDLQPGGAPDPAAYKKQSGGILDTLEDMLEKSKQQHADAQKAEMNSKFDFDMLKQKLEDAVKFGEKEMGETKSDKAAAEEAKATAEGELANEDKGVKSDATHLKDLQQECMTKASAYESSQHARGEELTALGKAKEILEEKTGGAASRAYSFLQLESSSRAAAMEQEVKDRVLAQIQKIAEDGSTELSFLAQRIESAQMVGADPFGKVKGMIGEMIEKLIADAAKEASHKAFCDKELAETGAKRDEKNDDIDDLSTKIDKATAKIAKLKEDVATLQSELAAIADAQRKATSMRSDEAAAWKDAKADYEAGVEGVGMALQVLRDYYAEDKQALLQTTHDKAAGAAGGIIGMLEVVESDFSKNLAEGSATEAMAQETYEQMTQDNKVATTEKSTAVKYKTKDSKETASHLAELKSDREGTQKELDAVMEYWDKLQPMCIAKPETYAERKARREAEISGLKQALEILENEAGGAFLQVRRSVRRA